MENRYQSTDPALLKKTVVEEEEVEIDLLALLNAFRRNFLLIIACALAFALVAGIYTEFLVTPLYTSTASAYLVSTNDSLLNLQDLQLSNNIVADYVDIIKSRTILEDVIEKMELPYTFKELHKMVQVTNPNDTHIIKITVTDPDPELARDIANNLTEHAVDCIADIMEVSSPNIYDKAVVATEQTSPHLTKTVVIAFVLGAVVACGIITLITVMDTTIKTAEDIENRCGMVTLTKVYFEGGKKKKGYGYGYGKGYGYGYGYGYGSGDGTDSKKAQPAKKVKKDSEGGTKK